MSRSFVAWLWLLSTFPVLAVLYVLPYWALVYCVIGFAALQTAHQASPVVLAWISPRFRQIMRPNPQLYIILPALVFIAAMALPYAWCAGIYFSWNLYHYGMQHFGVLNLCRQLRRWRIEAAIAILLLTCAVTFLSTYNKRLMEFPVMALGFNHWIVDLGLSFRVTLRPWLFAVIVLLAGLSAYITWMPEPRGVLPRAQWLVQASMALGFVHFLYSSWVWRLSDNRIRDAWGIVSA